MRRLVLAFVWLAACGDDDGGVDPGPVDAGMVDAGDEPEATLTRYVIDLVQNGTSNSADPRPYGEFSDLPDPDGDQNEEAAYQALFPR